MPELGAVCQQDSVGGALNGIFLNRALADLIVRDAIFDVDSCAGNKNLANVVILIRITILHIGERIVLSAKLAWDRVDIQILFTHAADDHIQVISDDGNMEIIRNKICDQSTGGATVNKNNISIVDKPGCKAGYFFLFLHVDGILGMEKTDRWSGKGNGSIGFDNLILAGKFI